jgi:hypothetical protein
MKALLWLPLLGALSGCAGMHWHCESNIPAAANACTKFQMQVMQATPVSCPKGAVAGGKVSAKKDGAVIGTMYRTEGVVLCRP